MIPFLKKNKDGKKQPKSTVLRTAQSEHFQPPHQRGYQ